jgi:L,D-transpeptidase YcbB
MKSAKSFWVVFIALLCLLLVCEQGCRNVRRKTVVTVPAKEVVAETLKAQSEISMPRDSLHPAYKGLQDEVADFYRRHKSKAVWCSQTDLSESGDSLVRFISNVRYYGLLPSNYHFQAIAENLNRGVTTSVRLDALLTDAFLSIAKDLRFGRLSYRDNASDSITTHLLDSVAANGGVLRCFNSMEPQFEGYQQLKNGLKVILDSLPLSERLAVLQNSDGILDSLTTRIQTIDINLERWRSERQLWGGRYLLVNIPAFMLYVVSDGAAVMESRVIVGKPETPTPELTSMLECLITYPYWHVPRKIAVEEYLPIIQGDTTFLYRNNFDVLDRKGSILDPDSVAWSTFSKNYFPVSLRQREGTENSLGIVKFVFDNPYAVFLHDTNARRLFNSDVRTYSHGCIRVEQAVKLSHYLLTGDLKGHSSLFNRYVKEKVRHTINFPSSVPIHIRYFTVAAKGNALMFYKDIYGKDECLMKALYGEENSITHDAMQKSVQ